MIFDSSSLRLISIDGEQITHIPSKYGPCTICPAALSQILFDSLHCLDNRPLKERFEIMDWLTMPDGISSPQAPIFHEYLSLVASGHHGEPRKISLFAALLFWDGRFDNIGFFSRNKESWARAFSLLRETVEGLVDYASFEDTKILIRGVSGACYSIYPTHGSGFSVSMIDSVPRYGICIVEDEYCKELPFPDLLTTVVLSLRNDLRT